MTYTFEFDPAKSASNLAKHGLDFLTAQQLWEDEQAEFGNAEDRGERREFMFAQLYGRVWTTVFVRRADRIRLISVRRSRRDEEDYYESRKS